MMHGIAWRAWHGMGMAVYMVWPGGHKMAKGMVWRGIAWCNAWPGNAWYMVWPGSSGKV